MNHGSRSGHFWWSLPLLMTFPAVAHGLTITEINYQPPAGGPNLQFVEVYNNDATALDISGYYFSKGITFTFPEPTILVGRSYLVVCADLTAFQARYPITNVIGNFEGVLHPLGETLALASNGGVEQVRVSYNDRGKWPSAPKGTGHTLSLLNPYLDPDDGVSWSASRELGGTPGGVNFPSLEPHVEDTELLPRNAVWKYLKGTAEFSSPISNWRQIVFDDSSWLSGPTGIGYGDGDDATVLADMQQAGANPGYWSVACRKTLTLTAAQIAGISSLIFEVDYDDGFVAYLNGTEVARAGVGTAGQDAPFNTPATAHEASAGAGGNPPQAFDISSFTSLLQAGNNVLAVQVHNTALTSSDLSFIPRLLSRRVVTPTAGLEVPLVLNELFARTSGERWIELYNAGSALLNVAGYYLSDNAAVLGKYAIPAGTTIPAHGFLVVNESQSGLVFSGAEVTLFLTLPDRSAVIDARVFDDLAAPQLAGYSDARFPDGSSRWVYARTPTRGAANQLQVEKDLVINEIMYDPFQSRPADGQPLEVRPGEYIELYNKGSRTISLKGFAFTKGIDYSFGDAVALGPGEYLVVAQDPTYIESTYGITNVVGPWAGSLQNNGETIRLEDPAGNAVNEIKYSSGGEWPVLAGGSGSSLELIDPRQDNSAGTAWAASDESQKAVWTKLSYTGSYAQQVESVIHFTPMTDGSFLLDDVQILLGATNYVPNSGFETDTNPWVMQGSLVHSGRTTDESHSGNACLQVIATSGGDMRDNRLVIPTSPAMTSGTYTVNFWVRWKYGGNMILVSGFDNAMAKTLWFPVPRNLGTPGRENSATAALRAATGGTNLGPVISGVTQRPVRPGPGQAVTVSAAISDADNVQSAELRYRLGGLGNGVFTPLAMNDGGSAGDVRAGDGIYSATLPGFNLGDRVVFYFEATDGTGLKRRYPLDAPARTLLYQVNNAITTPLLLYRLSMNSDSQTELETRQLHSDDPIYGTFVFEDSEIYYQVGLHYHGSPWNRPGSPRMFKLDFPDAHPFHGLTKFNISRYGENQNEATAYYTIGRTGRPDSPSPRGDYRFIRWELNGSDQGLMSHVEVVDKAYVSRWWPADKDGLLLRANGKITFHLDDSWNLSSWASFTYRGSSKESYRWNWDLHTRILEDEWSPLVDFMKVMDPAQTPSGAAFDTAVKQVLDVEEMVRVLAVRVLNDDWDGIGVGNGQNAYIYYAPNEGRWKYIPWDMDHTYANTGATLSPSVDPGVTRLLARPEFRRMYLQTFKEMLDQTWNVDRLALVLDPTQAMGVPNGDGIKNFVGARSPSVVSSLGTDPTFKIRTNGGRDLVVSTASTNIDGDAPLAVRTILLNGDPPSLTWTTSTGWRAAVALQPGANPLEFLAYDGEGTLVGRATMTVTSTYQWNPPVINSVDPASGPQLGGTTVVITGTDFHPGLKVTFGTTDSPSVQVISSVEVHAVSPAGSGQVDVKVANVDGKSVVKTAGFTFTGSRFIRGDLDGDGAVKAADAIRILNYLFRGGALDCLEAADANDDSSVDLSDVLRILLYLYGGRPAPPPPFPTLGYDATPDSLGCAAGA
jgi:hypothetical protein